MKATCKDVVVIGLLVTLCGAFLAILCVRQYKFQRGVVIPKSVSGLISEYLAKDMYGNPPKMNYAPYITGGGADSMSDDLEYMCSESRALYSVFYLLDYGFANYRIEVVSDNFVKVYLLNEEDDVLPPPIGFWYTLNHIDGRIKSWRAARLLPFSRYDDEYQEVWDELYS